LLFFYCDYFLFLFVVIVVVMQTTEQLTQLDTQLN
jgi:hypothetical protein